MFKNYLKVAIRSLFRDKVYSFINVIGFSIGIACSFLILIWVQDEVRYDRFHEEGERIYRILEDASDDTESLKVGVTAPGLAPHLEKDFPEIEHATTYKSLGSYLFRTKDNTTNVENRMALARENFFEIFSFKFIEGDPKNCLKDPGKIVLTESLANRYFEAGNAIGQTIELVDFGTFIVSAVIEDVHHSHIEFNYLLPFDNVEKVYGHEPDYMHVLNFITYVLLEKGADPSDLDKKLQNYTEKFSEPDNGEEVNPLFTQPLFDAYLKSSDFSYDFITTGDIKSVYIFSVIAIVVLLIACINFMNLTTARAANRAKEIGIRKVHGARKRNIILQFYFESFLITVISFFIALIIVELTLPVFNSVAGKELSISVLKEPVLIIFFALIAIFTALIAGSYPALYLSSFIPQKVLKGNLSSGSRAAIFRKLLVIIQFSISVILIVSTIIVSKQMHYIQNKKLGYDKEQLIYARLTEQVKSSYDQFKERVKKLPGVVNVSALDNLPIYAGPSSMIVEWEGNPGERSLRMHSVMVDYDFLETMEMELLKGRALTHEFNDDSNTVFILNETAVDKMNLKEPIGSKFSLQGKEGTIVGVVKDFHYNTIHHKITPMTLVLDKPNTHSVMIKLADNSQDKTIEKIQGIWKTVEPNYPFNYGYLDQLLETRYKKEAQTQKLFNYFSIFAIIISCLGLFGLSSFLAENRRKEIGIRKVMGSSVTQLVVKLSTEFLKWVVIANVIAIPVAYILMDKWLQGFAFRINLPFMAFFVALILALLIAVITVSYQTIRTAHANPIDTLRYE